MAVLASSSAVLIPPSADPNASASQVSSGGSSRPVSRGEETARSPEAGLVRQVLGEYREMPGLALTMKQAARLWGSDEVTCRRIADVLVGQHLLRWSRDGRRLMCAD